MKKIYQISLVLVVLMLLQTLCWQKTARPAFLEKSANGEQRPNKQGNSAAVQPVFQNFDVPYRIFEVDAAQEKTIRLENGTEIQIPASAFEDRNGNPVSGKVQLHYREFHTAPEIIASGIPMTYDSGGVTHHFESAGMFEIRGAQQEEEVFIAGGKSLNVRMASFHPDNDFNFYRLDEPSQEIAFSAPFATAAYANKTGQKAPKWQYLGTAAASPNERKKEKLAALEKKLQQAEQTARERAEKEAAEQMTQQSGKFKNRFRLRFNTKSYPETAAFQSLEWEFAGKNENLNPLKNKWVLDTEWNQVELTRTHYRYINLPGHTGVVRSAQFSADGKYLVTTSGPVARVWNTKGKLLREISGHNGAVRDAGFSPDQKYIYTFVGGGVYLWNRAGELHCRLSGHKEIVSHVSFSPNMKLILTRGGDEVRLWDVEGRLIQKFTPDKLHAVYENIGFAEDGKKIVITYADQVTYMDLQCNIIAMEARQQEPKLQIKGDSVLFGERSAITQFRGHRKKVRHASFSPDRELVLTTSSDKTAKVWQKDGNLLCNLTTHLFPVQYGAFSPDANHIVTISYDESDVYSQNRESVKLWIRVKPDEHIYNLELYNKPLSREQLEQDRYYFATTIKISDRKNATADLDSLTRSYQAEVRQRIAQEKMQIEQLEADLVRSYPVTSFGTHNWDRIANPSAITCRPVFELQADIQFANPAVYYVTGTNATIIVKGSYNDFRTLLFNPEMANYLLMILPGGKTAFFSPQDFKNLVNTRPAAADHHWLATLKMTVYDRPASLKEFTQLFGGNDLSVKSM